MKNIIFLILINILFPSVNAYIEDINNSINNMEIDKARQIFNNAIKEFDSSAEIFYAGAKIQKILGNLDMSNKYYIKSIDFDPKNTLYREKQEELTKMRNAFTTAQKTYNSGQLDNAIEEYKSIDNSFGPSARCYYELGIVYKAITNYKKAIENFKTAKNIDPKEEKYNKAIKSIAQTMAVNGEAEYRRQEYESAISFYKNAITYYPDFTSAIFKLSKTFYKIQDFDNAIIYLKKGLLIDPNQEQSEKMLGIIYEKLDNDSQALIHYNNSININENEYQVYYLIGKLHLDNNRLLEAKKMLNKSISIEPRYYKAYGALGKVEEESENLNLAIDNYKKSIEYNRKKKDVHIDYYRLASVYNIIKEYDNAKKSAKNSINIKRNYAPAYFELGIAEKALGNTVAAKDSFEKAKKDRNWRKSAQFELELINKGL